MSDSPYSGVAEGGWTYVTRQLIAEHPLKAEEIVEVVLKSWEAIFHSKIGASGFLIGKDIFPKPQIMGFLLHELIPLEFQSRYPALWRGEKTSQDKDLVYIPDDRFSVEIKTSSQRGIFGNRSYAQEGKAGKKSKSGYYLAINFDKFGTQGLHPRIRVIRFGWLDHTDWIGQKAATGQQASLSAATEQSKLIILYQQC
jgi:hypothetical protein